MLEIREAEVNQWPLLSGVTGVSYSHSRCGRASSFQLVVTLLHSTPCSRDSRPCWPVVAPSPLQTAAVHPQSSPLALSISSPITAPLGSGVWLASSGKDWFGTSRIPAPSAFRAALPQLLPRLCKFQFLKQIPYPVILSSSASLVEQ